MKSPILQLTLCLTHDCNLRCSYCYGGEKAGRHMSLETVQHALSMATDRGADRLRVIFFGGEPLLRWPELKQATSLARTAAEEAGLELDLTVTTNGTLLRDLEARWLASEGFVVALSCDGAAEAHDENRVDLAGRGSHARAVAGLDAALQAGARVRAVLVMDTSNASRLGDSVSWLAARGADDFVVNVNWSADWSAPGIDLEAAYESLADRYVEAYRRGRPFWVSVIDDKIVTAIRGAYLPHERCDMGRRDLVVAPSGRLYPCDRLVGEDWNDEMAIGDVRRGVDPACILELVGRACNLPDECLECDLRERCRNRCGCANLAMTGSLDEPSDLLCRHEQAAIRSADRAASVLYDERNHQFLKNHYGSGVS